MAKLSQQDLDTLIYDLLCCGLPTQGLTKVVKETTLLQLCLSAIDVFKDQEAMLELDGPVHICGDTHGQYGDLLRLFDKCGFPPESNYLFLGDYVDRGANGLENVSLLFSFKVKYPMNVFLLRGNHETRNVNQMYGFHEECIRRYTLRLYNNFSECFAWMPLTALIGDKILCMHGGISPDLDSLDQLRQIDRPREPLMQGLDVDVLWADPLPGVSGFVANKRGASYCFGEDTLNEKLQHLDLDMVVRAHQVVQDGFEFFCNRKLVTVFSAPHYTGQFSNSGAVMLVDSELQCSFIILKPHFLEAEPDKMIPTFSPSRERTLKNMLELDKGEKLMEEEKKDDQSSVAPVETPAKPTDLEEELKKEEKKEDETE